MIQVLQKPLGRSSTQHMAGDCGTIHAHKTMRLIPAEKNQLIDLVLQSGLNLLSFDVSDDFSSITFKYKDDYFYYTIRQYAYNGYTNIRCNIENRNELKTNFNWQHTKTYFTNWLKSVLNDRAEHQKFLTIAYRTTLPAIASISERFIIIFQQAENAELLKLNELVGFGYRKAFEILIRDYAISIDVSKKEEIINMSIGDCINGYIGSDDVKILAHRIFWLGNDHAHYTRLHENSTTSDIKELILKSLSWMQAHEEWKVIEAKMKEEAVETERLIQPRKRESLRKVPVVPVKELKEGAQ